MRYIEQQQQLVEQMNRAHEDRMRYIEKEREKEQIKQAAKAEAEAAYKEGWIESQKKVAQAIALMKLLKSKGFDTTTYSSGEALNDYEAYYIENEDFPDDLDDEELEEVNKYMAKEGAKIARVQQVAPKGAAALADAIDELF